jgi:hypothetical protein
VYAVPRQEPLRQIVYTSSPRRPPARRRVVRQVIMPQDLPWEEEHLTYEAQHNMALQVHEQLQQPVQYVSRAPQPRTVVTRQAFIENERTVRVQSAPRQDLYRSISPEYRPAPRRKVHGPETLTYSSMHTAYLRSVAQPDDARARWVHQESEAGVERVSKPNRATAVAPSDGAEHLTPQSVDTAQTQLIKQQVRTPGGGKRAADPTTEAEDFKVSMHRAAQAMHVEAADPPAPSTDADSAPPQPAQPIQAADPPDPPPATQAAVSPLPPQATDTAPPPALATHGQPADSPPSPVDASSPSSSAD